GRAEGIRRMHRGLFVTGTDTGVGKTVVSAALAIRFPGCTYWKPVQTGIEQDDDAADVHRLAGCSIAEGIRLPRPVSPHLAARLSGTTITLEDLRLRWAGRGPAPLVGQVPDLPRREGAVWIVEGA